RRGAQLGSPPDRPHAPPGSRQHPRRGTGDRGRASALDRRPRTPIAGFHLDADAAGAARDDLPVGSPRRHGFGQTGAPERGCEPEVHEPGTPDVDGSEPAVAISQPFRHERRDGARRFPELAGEHEGDVACEVPEGRIPGRIDPEPRNRAGPEEPRFDGVAQRFTNKRVNVRLHPGSRAKGTAWWRTRRGPGEHSWNSVVPTPHGDVNLRM